MTCIVGLIAKDGSVIMGGDSAGVAGLNLMVRKDPKVFLKGQFVYGFTSSFRMGQLLQYQFTPPDHDPRWDVDTYLKTVWIDALRKSLETGGYARKNNGEESAGQFLFGYKGRLFGVDADYQVFEPVAPYDSVGCGHGFAKGAMFATEGLGMADDRRVMIALQSAEAHSGGVRGPFTICSL